MSDLASLLDALQPRTMVAAQPADLDDLRESAWNQGFAAGREAAVAELAPLRERLAAAAAAFASAPRVDVTLLRPVAVEIVCQVAEAVLLAELEVGAKVLIPLVDAALALVGLGAAATLRMHPATLAELAGELGDIAVAEDAGLPIDAFEIGGETFVIAAGLRARLVEIMEEMA